MKIAIKKNIISDYSQDIDRAINKIEVTDIKNKSLGILKAIAAVNEFMAALKRNNKKIIFIGNGGSASIASHQAVDYWKNGKIKAISFNDSSLLTCLSNDFGYPQVFSKAIEHFAEKGDLLFAISSSGKSPNILNGVRAARKKGCRILTLSGFKKNNPLRKLGDINFYIASASYGIVEISHLLICHSILDYLMNSKKCD